VSKYASVLFISSQLPGYASTSPTACIIAGGGGGAPAAGERVRESRLSELSAGSPAIHDLLPVVWR
jgi:hypothetical protein